MQFKQECIPRGTTTLICCITNILRTFFKIYTRTIRLYRLYFNCIYGRMLFLSVQSCLKKHESDQILYRFACFKHCFPYLKIKTNSIISKTVTNPIPSKPKLSQIQYHQNQNCDKSNTKAIKTISKPRFKTKTSKLVLVFGACLIILIALGIIQTSCAIQIR